MKGEYLNAKLSGLHISTLYAFFLRRVFYKIYPFLLGLLMRAPYS